MSFHHAVETRAEQAEEADRREIYRKMSFPLSFLCCTRCILKKRYKKILCLKFRISEVALKIKLRMFKQTFHIL